jgi:hypothetical protein
MAKTCIFVLVDIISMLLVGGAPFVIKWYFDRRRITDRNKVRLLAGRIVCRINIRGPRLWLFWAAVAVVLASLICFVMERNNLALLLAACGYTLLSVWGFWPLLPRAERVRLAAQGYLVCPQCENDLGSSGNEGACPKCGLEYDADLLRGVWTRVIEGHVRGWRQLKRAWRWYWSLAPRLAERLRRALHGGVS